MRCIADIIDRAFDGVPYPGRENVCASKSAEWEFEPLFRCEDQWRQDWRKIPEELIVKEIRGILPFFSADGYKFIIPAFMKASLGAFKNIFDDDYATLLMYVVYSLCPDEVFEEYHLSKISKLNDEQKSAITAFLKYVRQHNIDDEYDDSITSALEKNMYSAMKSPFETP